MITWCVPVRQLEAVSGADSALYETVDRVNAQHRPGPPARRGPLTGALLRQMLRRVLRLPVALGVAVDVARALTASWDLPRSPRASGMVWVPTSPLRSLSPMSLAGVEGEGGRNGRRGRSRGSGRAPWCCALAGPPRRAAVSAAADVRRGHRQGRGRATVQMWEAPVGVVPPGASIWWAGRSCRPSRRLENAGSPLRDRQRPKCCPSCWVKPSPGTPPSRSPMMSTRRNRATGTGRANCCPAGSRPSSAPTAPIPQ